MVDSGTVLLRTQEQLVIWSRLAPKNLISDYPRPCGALNRCIQLPAACYASKSDHLALFHAITTQALIRRRVPRKFVFNSIENADAIPSIVITKDLHGAKSTGQSKRRSQRRVPSHPCGGGYFHYVSTVEMLLSLLPPSFPRIVCGLSAFAGPTTTRYPLPSFAFVMNPNLLGSIEIGALVAVILLGMVTVQIYVYYINFPHDSKIIKTLVRLQAAVPAHLADLEQIAIVWITETGHVAGICYGLYRMTVTRYGHLDLPIPLELCMAAILGNAIHPLVQAIFTARIYQLGTNAQNRFLTAICWAISGFILGATVLLSIKVFSATSIDQFEEEWDWLILGLFGATGGVDLLIAASMCYYTLKNRALLKPDTIRSGKIDTIISWTAQTGLFTSMAAITVAVCTYGSLSSFSPPAQFSTLLAQRTPPTRLPNRGPVRDISLDIPPKQPQPQPSAIFVSSRNPPQAPLTPGGEFTAKFGER
ncbi:hypothetical protein B0H19DRAFT_1061960 [Mycena capillaripes]|nr:hypothetical protein B0H19DRAFT_1061960 [Mycena capillaripes]